MNKSEIQELIEKYYRGETSLEEERVIASFLESDASGEFQSEKAQFLFFRTAQQEKSEKKFFDKIMDDKERNLQVNFRVVMRIAALVIVAMGVGYYVFTHRLNEVTTQANGYADQVLPDGSHVWIHHSSRLRYPSTFEKESREIYLEGEAYFEISKDVVRPFIIHSQKTTTRVTGTSFNLRSYDKDHVIELTVFTGKVIFGSDKKIEVIPGRRAIFEKKKKQLHQISVKGLNTLAWKTKQLVFTDTPLNDVLDDLSRYFNVIIEMDTKEEIRCHFSGNFKDPQLGDVLKAISFSMNVNFRLDHGIYYIDGHNCGASQ